MAMNGVNGVNTYSTTSIGVNPKKEDAQKDVKQELQQSQVEKAPENAGALTSALDALAANNSAGIAKASAPKTIKISDYVTPEQAARIAGFVTGFEDAIAKGMEDIMAEVPNASPEMAQAIAMASFELENY